jgi:hypothetical protein
MRRNLNDEQNGDIRRMNDNGRRDYDEERQFKSKMKNAFRNHCL